MLNDMDDEDNMKDEERYLNSMGLVCPKCKSGMIEIEASINVMLNGDDIGELSGFEWDDKACAGCRNPDQDCDWTGTVGELEEEG
jgi:hypothetical protein